MNLYVGIKLSFSSTQMKDARLKPNCFATCYQSSEFRKTRTTSQRPQANGTMEVFNRTLINMLAMYFQKGRKQWDNVLPQVMLAYRASIHSNTGVSHKIVLDHKVSTPLEDSIPRSKDPDEDHIKPVHEYMHTL
jgi:hypothetical protein